MNSINRGNHPEKVTCLICGQDFTGVSTEMCLLHAALAHPVEFVSSPRVQSALLELRSAAFFLGESIAHRLKGRT